MANGSRDAFYSIQNFGPSLVNPLFKSLKDRRVYSGSVIGGMGPSYQAGQRRMGALFEAGLGLTEKQQKMARRDIGAAIGKTSRVWRKLQGQISEALNTAIGEYRRAGSEGEKAILENYGVAREDIESGLAQSLPIIQKATTDAISDITSAYQDSMQAVGEYAKWADPQKLMDLGFHNIERGFSDFARKSKNMMQQMGVSPAVLREMGNQQLEQLLENGADFAGESVRQAMGMQREIAGMKSELAQNRGTALANLRTSSAEQQTGLIRNAAERKAALASEQGRTIAGLKMDVARGIGQTVGQGLNARVRAAEGQATSLGQLYGARADIAMKPDYLTYTRGFASLMGRGPTGRSFTPSRRARGVAFGAGITGGTKGWNNPPHALARKIKRR